MSLTMNKEEREAYLAGTHVAVMSVAADGRGPVSVPIWYAYEPGGEIRFCTQASSRKRKLIEAAGRFTVCVQNEIPPYQYVSVEGPVTAIEPCDYERVLRPIARAYLGQEQGDSYTDGVKERGGSLVIRMKPERWSSRDFGKA